MKQLVALMIVLLAASAAFGQGPARRGFTLELGGGLAYNRVSPDKGDSDTGTGIAGLSTSLGGFVTENLAIAFRANGSPQFSADNSDVDLFNAFYGVVGQYWVNDRFFVGGGFGIGLADIVESDYKGDPEVGYALDLRAGYAVICGEKHAMNLSVEVMPAFYDGDEFYRGTITTVAAMVEWQMF